MTAIRGLLMAAGIAVGVYGAVLLLDNPTKILLRIAVWAAAGVLLPDAAFAPACVALGSNERPKFVAITSPSVSCAEVAPRGPDRPARRPRPG